MDTIRIDVKNKLELKLEDLTFFQGKLKDLSIDNYKKLKGEILKRGFSDPILIWKNKGKNYILSGHQRYRVLVKMHQDGFHVPKIPCIEIRAKDSKEAKHKVLAMASQYGHISGQGLYEFISDSKIDLPELVDSFEFPEINFKGFIKEYFEEEPKTKKENKEKVCPNCGYDLAQKESS